MPQVRNKFTGKLRKRLPMELYVIMLFVFFFLTPVIVPREACALELDRVSIDRYELDVVEKDVLTVYIAPYLQDISVQCVPLDRSSPFDLQVSTNYTDPYFGKLAAVWLKPGSQGQYNLTIAFHNDEAWDYNVGVYAQASDFYLDFYGKNVKTYGYFLQLRGPYTRLSGNWTINILLNCRSRSRPIFTIELPTPVNLMLLVSTAGFVVYLNVFLFLDVYFKNKKELVSNKRWILLGVVVLISALAIYQLYNFTTFVLPGGV